MPNFNIFKIKRPVIEMMTRYFRLYIMRRVTKKRINVYINSNSFDRPSVLRNSHENHNSIGGRYKSV
jgi:hypothetical protein